VKHAQERGSALSKAKSAEGGPEYNAKKPGVFKKNGSKSSKSTFILEQQIQQKPNRKTLKARERKLPDQTQQKQSNVGCSSEHASENPYKKNQTTVPTTPKTT